MEPPFHQLRHTSIARAHVVHHWTLKVSGWEYPTYGPSHTSFLTETFFGHRLHGDNISAMATAGSAPFRMKATPHTGEPNFLYHVGYLIMYSTSGTNAFSVTASDEYTGQNLFWWEKMSFQTPRQNPLDNEIKDRLRKNSLWATIPMGRDFYT